MAYVCKIASMEEMERKWNAEILRNIDEKDNWVAWKAEAMENEINHCSITCYGILDLFIMSNKDEKHIRMGQRLMSGIMQKP